jgi:25S rRNA (uracil2634-N3)-methyltransferase
MRSVEAFDSDIYSGYQAQRTHPASFRGEPPSTTGARYFIFVKDPTIHPQDPRSSTRSSNAGDMGPRASKKNTKVLTKVSETLKTLCRLSVSLFVSWWQFHQGKAKQAETAPTANLNCKVCGIAFRDSKKFNGHMNSAKHARKVKQQQKRK